MSRIVCKWWGHSNWNDETTRADILNSSFGRVGSQTARVRSLGRLWTQSTLQSCPEDISCIQSGFRALRKNLGHIQSRWCLLFWTGRGRERMGSMLRCWPLPGGIQRDKPDIPSPHRPEYCHHHCTAQICSLHIYCISVPFPESTAHTTFAQ